MQLTTDTTNHDHLAAVSGECAGDEGQAVVFRLDDEEFGLDINSVKEIVRVPDITPIPRSPAYVSGICNLRGSVLPVIDTRKRFAMENRENTDQTRLLVVETNGAQTSMVVDHVREVMRIRHSLVEPPPKVCKGVDKEFLNGVVKMDEGKRLIMMLNLNEVVAVDRDAGSKAEKSADCLTESGARNQSAVEEDQLVSFQISGDEYAFDISKVREILKITDITTVPNVPDYVMGLFTIRNHLLPILDLRRLLGLPSLASERQAILDKAAKDERAWIENLKHVLAADLPYTGSTNARNTPFGEWLEKYNTSSVEVEAVIKQIKRNRILLYENTVIVLEKRQTNKEEALAMLEKRITPLVDAILDDISRLGETMAAKITDDQRALVVESGDMTIGYQVDWVDEVLRIPKSVIDETPAMARSERKELRAVAKLDEGKRLIMIMNEAALVNQETSAVLSQIQNHPEDKKNHDEAENKTLMEKSLEEEQLVTFSIDKEEYGIRIMQVQEINRISEITKVPRAPNFIDGMTNLRGSVIPVINIRRLFDLEDKATDDSTRIIIVDIAGIKTGLRVDRVNEVLRLAKSEIEETPEIVSDGSAAFLQGVCKIENGKRMVILLDVGRILGAREMRSLDEVTRKEKQKSVDEACEEDPSVKSDE